MSGFSPDWLELREPFDRAARATAADGLGWPAFAARLRARAGEAPLQVVDLGCGTGASLRAVAPQLGGRQHWRLLDHDPALLAALPASLAQWAAGTGCVLETEGGGLRLRGPRLDLSVAWRRLDLAAGLRRAGIAGADLVTASALLDLVSARWLEQLITACCEAGAAVYWALSVDERIAWQPAAAADAAVHRHFRAHQRRDKGWGPALGGTAAAAAARALRQAGYGVAAAPSDWRVDGAGGAADLALLRRMVDGIAAAAREQAPQAQALVQGWRRLRLAQLADPAQAAALRLRVGHVDLLGWPLQARVSRGARRASPGPRAGRRPV